MPRGDGASRSVTVIGGSILSARALQVTTVLHALKKLGFNLDFDEDKISQLVDLQVKLEHDCCSSNFEDEISELDDVDFLTKQSVQKWAQTLSMSDEEFIRQQQVTTQVSDLLRSFVKK